MKNNKPANASKETAPTTSNVCGTDTAATGKAAKDAKKACKEKIDSAVDDLRTPGAEAA